MERPSNNDEINLLDSWRVIKKRQRMIGVVVGVITLLTIIYSLMMPKYYKADVVIMPVRGGGGGGALAGLTAQFGGLASLVGIGGGAQTPSQQFMALLKTRTLAENVINKYELMSTLFRKTGNKGPTMDGAIGALLGGYMKFRNDENNGTIVISAELTDPKLAVEVANGYVEGLQLLINENSFTVAKKNRIFIEGRLEQNKRELLEAGKELNEFYKGTRVSSINSRLDVPIAQEQSDLASGNEQLADLEKKKENVDAVLRQAQGEEKIVKNVPQQVYLQYLTLQRTLLSQINSMLTQQYEMSKIEESKDDLAFQVIDPARAPEYRSKPRRAQMVKLAFLGSLFFGIFLAFFLEYIEKTKKQGMA